MTTLGSNSGARAPTGMKVAPTSYQKIEVATTVLRRLLPVVNQAEGRYMLDGWRILEQTLPKAGFDYRVAKVTELDDCAAFTIPDMKLVVMREDVYEGLFDGSRFSHSTVIHELSHIALGHAVTLHRGAAAGAHKFYEDSEWQAKAMTAALMMPPEAFRQAPSPAALAALCGTSVEAASYRIERLRKTGNMT